jgi:hypothetical protein
VSGDVERDSSKTFLISASDTTADTLKAVMDAWIDPGITADSDSCAAYRNLNAGYKHRNVNHITGLVDERTGAPTNTTDSKWLQVKVFLSFYNKMGLHSSSRSLPVHSEVQDQLTKFLHFVATIDWSMSHPFKNMCHETYR